MGFDLDNLEDRNDSVTWVPEEGVTLVRFLPPSSSYFDPKAKMTHIAKKFYMHYNVEGLDGSKRIVCPKTFGESNFCPVCAKEFSLRKKGTDTATTVAKKIRQKQRYIFNVLIKNKDTSNYEMKYYECGPGVFKDVMKYMDKEWCLATDPAFGTLFDPKNGRWFKIRKIPAEKSDTGYTKYEILPFPDRESVEDKLPSDFKEILDGAVTVIPKEISSDEITKMLGWGSSEGQFVGTSEEVDDTGIKDLEDDFNTSSSSDEDLSSEFVDETDKPQVDVDVKECLGKFNADDTDCINCVVRKECIVKSIQSGAF